MKKLMAPIMGLLLLLPLNLFAEVKGIYLSQVTAENPNEVQYLIRNAKEVGISNFVVDYTHPNPIYNQSIDLIKKSGINYIARIVVFPDGGTPSLVNSSPYLEKRLAQIKGAINLGASAIQLDYIRYKSSQRPSEKNAEDITGVIRYFKENIKETGVPLQVDVFGVSSFAPSIYIGQNVQLMAPVVEAINPMVYPSHYEPFREAALKPYETVYDSLTALKKQIAPSDVQIHAYIELFNYRYPMSTASRVKYIQAQLQAVKDAGADGWYAWSAGNRYDILFNVLRQNQQQLAENDQ